jgi:hypothetical protein
MGICRARGLDGAEFAWGGELTPGGKQMAATTALVAGSAVPAAEMAQAQKRPPAQPKPAAKPAPAQSRQNPNILVIMGDDIGLTNVSAYSMGLMGYRISTDEAARTVWIGRFRCCDQLR